MKKLIFLVLAAGCSQSVRPQHSSIRTEPQSLAFGSHDAGTQTTLAVTIANDGQAALTVTQIAVNGSSAFSESGSVTTIPGGGSATVHVTYTAPAAAGTQTATLDIASNADNAPQLSVPLSGTSVIPTFALTVNHAGSGAVTSSPAGISCGATCTASYAPGTQVTLTATADSGARFVGWSGACTNATGTCTVTMDAAKEVTANFVAQFAVVVIFAGSGTVGFSGAALPCTAACVRNFDVGTTVSLSASPNGLDTFEGFSGGCSGATCSLTAAASVTATFTHRVTLTADKTGNGTVTSSGSIDCGATCSEVVVSGTQVTLSAVADSGWHFTGWSGGCTNTSGDCVVTVNDDTTVDATFAQNTGFSIGGVVTGLSGTGFVLHDADTGEDLGVTTNGAFTFATPATSYTVSVKTAPTQPDATAQTCNITGGSGTASADVTDIAVDCTPYVVAGSLQSPYDLRINGSTLYFVSNIQTGQSCYNSGLGDKVWKVAAAGGTPGAIADVEHAGGNCGVYGPVFDSTKLYWSNYANGAVWSANLDGTGATSFATTATYTNAFVLDPAGADFYYFGYAAYAIKQMTVAGTNKQTFANVSQVNGLNLAIDGTYLYWTDSLAGAVRKLALSTATLPGTPTDLATTENSPFAPFVNATRLYWSAGTALRYLDLPSGTAQTLATGIPAPNNAVADASSAWVVSQGTSANNYTDGVIYRVPAAGGAKVAVAKGLDHPQYVVIDAGHVYWTNGAFGTTTGSITMIVK